jgi:hypothetical protein
MIRTTFRPRVEALDPRILPDANPLTADVVGPFAVGMYPQDPPPAGTHRHSREWLTDAREHSDRILARAQAAIEAGDDAFLQIRYDGTADMSNALQDGVRSVLTWAQNLEARENTAVTQARQRYNRDLAAGRLDAARLAHLDEAYHSQAEARAGELRMRLAGLLQLNGRQLADAVNAELTRAQQESTQNFQDAQDYFGRFQQNRAPQREYRLRAGRAQVSGDYFERFSTMVNGVARRFGQ